MYVAEYKKGTTDATEAYEIVELRMERSEGKASLKSLICLMIWLQNGWVIWIESRVKHVKVRLFLMLMASWDDSTILLCWKIDDSKLIAAFDPLTHNVRFVNRNQV